MSSDPVNIAIERCEGAHDLLSAALSGYLDSCISLDTVLRLECGHRNASDSIISRIESTLSFLYHDTARQLAQITSTLTRTRNRLVSSTYRLPDDVLLEIFLCVVYAPENESLSVEKCIRMTYSSLYNLMAVCLDWRDFAYNQGILWEIIPASDTWVKCQVTERIIQRAGSRGLRLAVTLPSTKPLPHLIKLVGQHASRFRALNVQSSSLKGIHALIRKLTQDDSRVSELSIIYHGRYHSDSPDKHESALLIHSKARDQAPFIRKIQSLSVLRLSGCLVQWNTITFSDRLVELSVRRIDLPNSGSAMASFLSAISTASELRDLRVIELRTCYNPAETARVMARPKIVFPNLQTLVLQGLWLNVLEIFLHALAPGSHLSTLHIDTQAVRIMHSFGRDVNGFDSEIIGLDRLITLLSRSQFSVGRLSLVGRSIRPNWLEASEVRRLLAVLPSLKELELVSWYLDSDFCSELSAGATPISVSDNECDKPVLPELELLELRQANLSDEEGLKRFLGNIPIQKMVFWEVSVTNYQTNSWKLLEGDDDIVKWLKRKVPSVYLLKSNE